MSKEDINGIWIDGAVPISVVLRNGPSLIPVIDVRSGLYVVIIAVT